MSQKAWQYFGNLLNPSYVVFNQSTPWGEKWEINFWNIAAVLNKSNKVL